MAFADSYVGLRRGDGLRRRQRAWRDVEALSGYGLDGDLVVLLRLSAGWDLWSAIDRIQRRDETWRRWIAIGLEAIVAVALMYRFARPPLLITAPSPWPVFG